jgi:hypothetical protein
MTADRDDLSPATRVVHSLRRPGATRTTASSTAGAAPRRNGRSPTR